MIHYLNKIEKVKFLCYNSVFKIFIKFVGSEIMTAVAITIPAFWAVMSFNLERFLVRDKVVPLLN
jgi:uncharacterized membrane protein YwzB